MAFGMTTKSQFMGIGQALSPSTRYVTTKVCKCSSRSMEEKDQKTAKRPSYHAIRRPRKHRSDRRQRYAESPDLDRVWGGLIVFGGEKVFFSSSAQIGRLIDNLSQGAEAGSFNILPDAQTHAPRPSESSSAHWTVEERLEHMLNSLGTS